jgi:predicted permease
MGLKTAYRSLRRSPGFTLLAVSILALGIGANSAIFSVVNAVLLRPLPYRDAGRIVTLSTAWKAERFQKDAIPAQVSALDFQDWQAQNTVFDSAALYFGALTSVSISGSAEYARVAGVSPEFFSVFQIEPVLGEANGSGVLISYGYWQAHFAGASNVIGRTIRVFRQTPQIIGVLPSGFAFPAETDVWFPLQPLPTDSRTRGGLNFLAIAHLKAGVGLTEAQSQMTSIASRLEQQYPETNKDRTTAVNPLRDNMVNSVRATLYMLLAAAGVILWIACANTATLLLARASGRTREIAVRAAIGASRSQIVRQLFGESLLLAVFGGGLGLALAGWGSAALVVLAPTGVPRLTGTSIDRWVLAFTLGASIVATVLAGLAPALQSSRVDLIEALKQNAARSSATGKTGRLRAALVVAEVALSVMLVCGAGLLVRSFLALSNVTLGFRPDHVLAMRTTVAMPQQQSNAFFQGLLRDITALPGVIAAGATMGPPGQVSSSGAYWVDRIPERLDLSTGTTDVLSVVAPGTFQALGIPLVSGRDFNDGDKADAPMVAIVNEAIVRKSFPSGDAVGRMIFCPFDSLNFELFRIVGVVGDIRQYGPAQPPSPECILPYRQHQYNGGTLTVVVRTAANPNSLTEVLRRLVQQHSTDVSVSFTTMEASLAENTATPRFRTLLLGLFAALALTLAMAGVYGVMSYVAGQRTGELGLRMALGAKPRQVLWLMLRQSVAIGGAGLLIGLLAAIASSRLLEAMLFEVKPNDPATYLAVSAALAISIAAAAFFPARRAANVDPLEALRQE